MKGMVEFVFSLDVPVNTENCIMPIGFLVIMCMTRGGSFAFVLLIILLRIGGLLMERIWSQNFGKLKIGLSCVMSIGWLRGLGELFD